MTIIWAGRKSSPIFRRSVMMIFTYGTSLQGEDHKQWGTPCQDAHCIKTIPENGWVIAAVADGVGSASRSDQGSQLAVDTVVNFCIENMPFTSGVVSAENDLIPLLRVAYNKAYKNIYELAKMEGNRFEDYDTTLDVAIYNGNQIIYGHCSDGGIIALNDNGYYDCVTDRMKGPDGETMIPLRSRKDWQFGIYPKSSSAILLFTDGLYDFARQDFLEKNWTTPLYIPLLKKLSNTNSLPKRTEIWTDYFEQFMSESFWDEHVTDDKTLVALINTGKVSAQVESNYYEEPDWEGMMQRLNERLYGPINSSPVDVQQEDSYQEKTIENNEGLLSDSLALNGDEAFAEDEDSVFKRRPKRSEVVSPNLEGYSLESQESLTNLDEEVILENKEGRQKTYWSKVRDKMSDMFKGD